MKTSFNWWLMAGLTLGLTACGESTDSDLAATAGAATDKIDFPAVDDKLDLGDKDTKLKGIPYKPFTVTANWKFTPDSVGRLNVLFIIDLSGSMEENDPLTGADCQRHKAVKALAESLKAKMKPGDEVNVAAVGFSDDAQVLNQFAPVDKFLTTATASGLCQQLQSTNYEAAFKSAAGTLAGLQALSKDKAAPVAAYFVTDGLPTSTKDKSVAAAADLRTALQGVHKDSTLSAVFLGITGGLDGSIFGPPQGVFVGPGAKPGLKPGAKPSLGLADDDGLDEISKQAMALLAEITGDKARVKGAAGAADLAAQLASFDRPKAGLDEDSVKIKLTNGKADRDYACKGDPACKITKLPDPQVGWTVTVTFPLVGAEGREIPNVMEISGKRTDDQKIRAKATVVFKSIR